MMYVERDKDGAIVRAYANPQEFPTEEVADNSPELLQFLDWTPFAPAVDMVDQVLADPAALARLKAALGGASA